MYHLHSKLEEEKADALREASNLRSRLADKETELKRLKDSLQATIRSLEEDKSAAGVEVGKLKKAIVALESEKNQALRDVARLKGELEVKETDLRVRNENMRRRTRGRRIYSDDDDDDLIIVHVHTNPMRRQKRSKFACWSRTRALCSVSWTNCGHPSTTARPRCSAWWPGTDGCRRRL